MKESSDFDIGVLISGGSWRQQLEDGCGRKSGGGGGGDVVDWCLVLFVDYFFFFGVEIWLPLLSAFEGGEVLFAISKWERRGQG